MDIYDNSKTDAGLPHLTSLRYLEFLILTRTAITDDGLAALGQMKSLIKLDVEINARVTIDGVDQLKSRQPDCSIRCWELKPKTSGGCPRHDDNELRETQMNHVADIAAIVS